MTATKLSPNPNDFQSSQHLMIQDEVQSLETRLLRAKRAYTTARVNLAHAATLAQGRPRAGDLVLAQVTKLGHHRRLESPDGRRAELYVGDEIVVCFADRYAPDQFEAEVPLDLAPCHLVAGGGVASLVHSQHSATRQATRIRPLGLLAHHSGEVLNVRHYALPTLLTTQSATHCDPNVRPECQQPLTLAVIGTSMNAGKTTACAGLVRGLSRSGVRVGTAKITGTGSGGDVWKVLDAGALLALDFTSAGMASTYKASLPDIIAGSTLLREHLAYAGAEVVVLEIADGVYQQETSALLQDPSFMAGIDGLFFAAGDAMGAAAGAAWLRERGLSPVALTGAMTASALAVREAHSATRLPVLSLPELESVDIAVWLTDALTARTGRQRGIHGAAMSAARMTDRTPPVKVESSLSSTALHAVK